MIHCHLLQPPGILLAGAQIVDIFGSWRSLSLCSEISEPLSSACSQKLTKSPLLALNYCCFWEKMVLIAKGRRRWKRVYWQTRAEGLGDATNLWILSTKENTLEKNGPHSRHFSLFTLIPSLLHHRDLLFSKYAKLWENGSPSPLPPLKTNQCFIQPETHISSFVFPPPLGR